MKYKKSLLILFGVLFLLTALTVYINRVVFPKWIKKIAVERLEQALKRKVEIGAIHFNWFRGFIIDKIKIYEKDSNHVFAQAQEVSFGILVFPSPHHVRVTIPFINVLSPSMHLVRTGPDAWNFSDISSSSTATASPAAPSAAVPATGSGAKPPSFELAWGGLTISDGQFQVDDMSNAHQWSEYFNNINLKLSLSYQGINYDFTADIPGKNGFIGATVYYQPLTQNTNAQIRLKNIDTASYLSLIDLPDMQLTSGTIQEINLTINYTKQETSAKGDVLIKNLDVTSEDQGFKGDIEIRDLDALYSDGDITARGSLSLSHMQTTVPGFEGRGNVQARVNDFKMTKRQMNFAGSIRAQNIFVGLKDRQIKAQDVVMDDIKVRQDNTSITSAGSIITRGLFIQWPDQQLKGDIAFKNVSMAAKDENNIVLDGDLQADNMATTIKGKNFDADRILLEGAHLLITDQKNMSLDARLSAEALNLRPQKHLFISTSLKTDHLALRINDGTLDASAAIDTSDGQFVLGGGKRIDASPHLELHLQTPLNDLSQMTYKGSITLSGASLKGFGPIKSLDNIELDADFQNDQATINALSADLLDTTVHINGTVANFKHPRLNIVAEADELDLSKIQKLMPQVANYGLSLEGAANLKVAFEGHVSDWQDGKIVATASVNKASLESSKLHQNIRDITGLLEVTPHSLKWKNTTAVYQNRLYNFSGSLEDFKNPRILASLSGPSLNVKADVAKNNDRIEINSLTGKYREAAFDGHGTVFLTAGGQPFFKINTEASSLLENLIKQLPAAQQNSLEALDPTGLISLTTSIEGYGLDWKNYRSSTTITSPSISLKSYSLTDMKISIDQGEGKVKNLSFDGKLYDGTVHAVASVDLLTQGMPYDLAFNIDSTDLHKLKMDSPLKMEEIDGKFYLTGVANGTMANFKNALHATGSVSIRDGFLAEFNLFKGLLGILNDALRLGQVEITDVDGNFTIEGQKIDTDNLRLKGPTIVLLTKGWVNFDQYCDLNVTVDTSSGVVPTIAHDVLSTINIRIYDKISDPKFKRKISVPQVINTLLKNFLQ